MTEARLALHDLAVARGGVTVLEGVSLALHPGEALLLRGPNGIGKTTLLRTVAGLQPPRSGRIDAAPDSIAYAAHADGLKATLTVAENLSFWRAVFGGPGIAPALAAMGLEGLAERPAGSLSAGQKRRLGLARLLVTGRPVWALDEPTVSLDSAASGLFAAMVGAHLATGGVALIASHVDLGLPAARVMDLSDYRAGPARTRTDGFDEAFA